MKNLTQEQLIKKLTEERDLAIKQLNSIGVGLGDNMDHVKKALEKQIPQKVEYGIDGSWGTEKEQPVCPVCDYFINQTYFIGEGKKVTYCEHCGQAIRWE